MTTTKCDICKITVKDNIENKASVYMPSLSWHDVCMPCMKKHGKILLKKLNYQGKNAKDKK